MSQAPKRLQCAQLAMDFLWARDRKGLEDMAAALKAIAAVCSDWNTEMLSCALEHWYCRHFHLWDCLIFMNPFTRRKMTLDSQRFVLAEVRSRTISTFKVHARFGGGKSLESDRVNITCSLNCCQSPVGRNVALSRRLAGHFSEEAYGDSDYYTRQSGHHVSTFLEHASGWLKSESSPRITVSPQQAGHYDLHISWVTQQGDVAVGQIAVACSRGCYRILKAITQDLAGIDGKHVLVLRGVSDAVMFPLDRNGHLTYSTAFRPHSPRLDNGSPRVESSERE